MLSQGEAEVEAPFDCGLRRAQAAAQDHEGARMTDHTRPPGKTTVAPEVLTSIARMAALSVPGVRGLAPVPGGVNRIFRRGADDGVRIILHENVVFADIYLLVKEDVNIREVGRNVQQQVARAIQEMVGMDVGQIEIHIENIDYEGTEA
jgi:uncharacterized alkaline shock family protein YloU